MRVCSPWRRIELWFPALCLVGGAMVGSCDCTGTTNPATDGGCQPGDPRCGYDSSVAPYDGAAGQDTGNTGRDGGGGGDSGVYRYDGGEVDPDLCPASSQVPTGCVGEVVEGTSNLCDGLDNDCDGTVDEVCPCTPGAVQRCFMGPPGHRNVGACSDGQQLCEMQGEAGGAWGPCEGGIAPRGEVCDDLDNDCNGCTDEVTGCTNPQGTCPGPNDPRTPDGRPFSTYQLRGGDFFSGSNAVAWHWSVTGTPCDKMFLALTGSVATPENGQLSYTLLNPSNREASIDFTLSGDYTVTLDVTLEGGQQFSCTWIIHVRAPGLRIELCWDATGPTADSYGGTLDVDLHLGKTGTTPQWFAANDCDYLSCRGDNGIWDYANTDLANCTGPGSRGGFDGSCPNPRLDIDNISESAQYVPENINVDNPRNGDRFRVMVHHYTGTDRAAAPLVNVYCGGELRGTYGAAPDLVQGFDQGGYRNGGSMWRVVDVVTQVDGSGNTTGCDLTPLRMPAGTGYYLTVDDSTY